MSDVLSTRPLHHRLDAVPVRIDEGKRLVALAVVGSRAYLRWRRWPSLTQRKGLNVRHGSKANASILGDVLWRRRVRFRPVADIRSTPDKSS